MICSSGGAAAALCAFLRLLVQLHRVPHQRIPRAQRPLARAAERAPVQAGRADQINGLETGQELEHSFKHDAVLHRHPTSSCASTSTSARARSTCQTRNKSRRSRRSRNRSRGGSRSSRSSIRSSSSSSSKSSSSNNSSNSSSNSRGGSDG